MDYKDTLEEARELWPTDYNGEEGEHELLIELFLSRGEYEWRDGELINQFPDESEAKQTDKFRKDRRESKRLLEELAVNHPSFSGIDLDFMLEVAPIPPHRIMELPDNKLMYGNVLFIPDDITPSWLIAAKKAMVIVKEFQVSSEGQKYLHLASKWIKELEEARK